jgi:PBP1b-binding outer membrane lipoprotein LpoB
MKPTVILSSIAIATLLVSGCVTVAATSTTANVEPKCKIAMSQPGRLNYDPARATDAEKAEARAKLASIELHLPASRNTASGFYGAIDEVLRDCP